MPKEKEEEIEWYFYIIFALILICFLLVFSTPFEKIVLSFWIYYLIYNGVMKFISEFFEKYSLLIIVLKITFGLPIILINFVFKSWYYFVQITLFSIITFGLLPSIVMEIIPKKYYLGALYLGVLISVIFFAYFGDFLWKLVKRFYGNRSENRIIKKSSNIAIIYIVMISVYIFYNFTEFSKVDISNLIEPSTFLILKEVLVTFIAIDGLRQLVEKIKK